MHKPIKQVYQTTKLTPRSLCNQQVLHKVNFGSSSCQMSQDDKKLLQNYILGDSVVKLRQFLAVKIVRLDSNIDGMWNVLHLCAKHDSLSCSKLCLKKLYQQDVQIYRVAINSKDQKGLTPLALSVISCSSRVTSILLQAGGNDLLSLDKNYRNPYDLAVYHKNSEAQNLIRPLVQSSVKEQQLNCAFLSTPYNDQPNISTKLLSCLKNLICCLKPTLQNDGESQKPQETQRELNSILTVDTTVSSDQQQQLTNISIREFSVRSKFRKGSIPLFDHSGPVDIQLANRKLSNCYVLLLTLNGYPWLLQQLITANKPLTNQGETYYSVNLLRGNTTTVFKVTPELPYNLQTLQLCYATSTKNVWPMVLEKGLSQYFGSYEQLAMASISQLLECTLNSCTKRFKFIENHLIQDSVSKKSVSCANAFEIFLEANYIVLLEETSQEEHPISDKQPAQCYSVLHVEKYNQTQLILVGCPFKSSTMLNDCFNESQALKGVRKQHQKGFPFAVWIEETKMKDHFKALYVSQLKHGLIRRETNFWNSNESEPNVVYFSVQVSKKAEGRALMAIYNEATNEYYKPTSVKYIKEEEIILFENSDRDLLFEEVTMFDLVQGSYIFRVEVPNLTRRGQASRLTCITWSVGVLQFQFVQERLAVLQWVEYRKDLILNQLADSLSLDCNESLQSNGSPLPPRLTIHPQGKFTVIVCCCNNAKQIKMAIKGQLIGDLQIMHGKKEAQSIVLVKMSNQFYAIIEQRQPIDKDSIILTVDSV